MSTFANDHERWADSLGAWLLGALPADEAEGFREHLAACPVCQEDAASLQVAADALPIGVAPHAPPPALKERLMAIVESEALAAAPAPAPRRERRRPWLARLSLRPALAIGLAALALGVAGGVLGSQALNDDARTISAQVEGSGRATLEVEDGRARLVAARLPAPPAGRVYQVWVDRGGPAPEPTDALFSTRGDGSASVDVPGSVDGVRAVMVTDEPRGGSEAPTGKLLLSAST
jgi:anti-sigma factor RsiW